MPVILAPTRREPRDVIHQGSAGERQEVYWPAAPGGRAASGPCLVQMLCSPAVLGSQVITYWPVAGSLLNRPARPGSGQCGVPGRSPACVVTMRRPMSLPHVVWLRSLVSCSGHDREARCTVIMALCPSTWSALTCCPGVTEVRDTLQEPANSAGVWASVDIHSTKVLSTSSTSTLTSHTKLCIVLPLCSRTRPQGKGLSQPWSRRSKWHSTSPHDLCGAGEGGDAPPRRTSSQRAGPSLGPCGPRQSCGSPAGAPWSPGPAAPWWLPSCCVGAAGVSLSSMPSLARLNSRSPCPRPLAISGSFCPPKKNRAISRMSRRSCGAKMLAWTSSIPTICLSPCVQLRVTPNHWTALRTRALFSSCDTRETAHVHA